MKGEPRCLIITGCPGAGKSTLANGLSGRLHLPVLSRDRLKEGYIHTVQVPHHQLPDTANAEVTGRFFALIDTYLGMGISLIAEAAFQHPVWDAGLRGLQTKSHLLGIICTAAEQIAWQRYVQRARADPEREQFHGEEIGQQISETGVATLLHSYDAPRFSFPTIQLDTGEIMVQSLDTAMSQIAHHWPQRWSPLS